jgi:hypothetical protein
MNKDLQALIKKAEAQGFTYRVTGKGHVMFKDADGKPVSTFSGTPSDGRSWKNSLARLKRAGFKP